IVILEAEKVIRPEHLPPEIRGGAGPLAARAIELPQDGIALASVERELIHQAMARAGGNQTRAAELLGIERDALRRRLAKHGFNQGDPASS
ncbi:MAG: AAA family ATPase, partial [Verrucomicrobia bacterium]|nr:AAA family ATPase [Verrucomicrobiota bacterium]